MKPTFFKHAMCALLAGAVLHAQAAPTPFKAAPSAQLQYGVKSRQHGFELSGVSSVGWQAQDGKYRITSETVASLLGKIVESSSEGTLDEQGLAPAQAAEKRLRKDRAVTTFRRDSKTIVFANADDEPAPLKGGEQDRLSVLWQLVGQARANPDRFTKDAAFEIVVAGPHHADRWQFRVLGRETVNTPLGPQPAIHLNRTPAARGDQALDIWLAPNLEWYPLRLRYTETDGDYIEQTLDKITPR
jgi:hypothetical protein